MMYKKSKTREVIKSVFEKLVEYILAFSGWTTSFIVLLIVIFLFTEASGLFFKSPIEGGFKVVVNQKNPITNLSSEDIMNIYDDKITTWDSLTDGSFKGKIKLIGLDDVPKFFSEAVIGKDFEGLDSCLSVLVDSFPNIIASLPEEFLVHTTVTKQGGDKTIGRIVEVSNISVSDFLLGRTWLPTAMPAAQFGTLPILLGTLWVSLWAIIFALPFGLAVAIYISEIAPDKVRNFYKPLIELLAGIPSVVYGFFGLIVIVPMVQNFFDLDVGETALSGSIVLAIMALPTIITIAEDSIKNVPTSVRNASYALGANKWQTIFRITLPYARSGIVAGAILGIGRAIGETMAILMVTGNAAVIPTTLLSPVRTIPATIAAELGEVASGSSHYEALFAIGCILFFITLGINILMSRVSKKKF